MLIFTTQNIKFFLEDFFSKCENVTKSAGNCGFAHIDLINL